MNDEENGMNDQEERQEDREIRQDSPWPSDDDNDEENEL